MVRDFYILIPVEHISKHFFNEKELALFFSALYILYKNVELYMVIHSHKA